MLRLCLQPKVAVRHINRQMQVSRYGFVSQFSVKHQAGNIDIVIDAVGQVHGHFALHRGGTIIYPFALRMNVACQLHVVVSVKKWTCIHLLHVHQHVIHLIINVVETFQMGLAAAIIGIAGQVHPHRLQIQHRGLEVRFRPELVGARVQPVRSNQVGVQIQQRISIDGVKRQVQCPERKRSIPDVQATGIVAVAAHIRQHIRSQSAGT